MRTPVPLFFSLSTAATTPRTTAFKSLQPSGSLSAGKPVASECVGARGKGHKKTPKTPTWVFGGFSDKLNSPCAETRPKTQQQQRCQQKKPTWSSSAHIFFVKRSQAFLISDMDMDFFFSIFVWCF
jgi:hypothetical protein